ncbi:MAG: hypothetical protein E7566_00900 [Ruminococcaceae bacterium]|nr:hypothetical protein [Oscillospiraceae bacterium]
MLRIFMCIVLVVSSTFLGNWFSLKLLRRCEDLFSIIESIQKIKTYINFGGYEICRVIALSFVSKEKFKAFTETEENENFLMWWEKCVTYISKTTALNKSDLELLNQFGENLGVTDIEGQISNCELYTKLFEERLNEAKLMENKNVRLYRILGFSLGCTVGLIVL